MSPKLVKTGSYFDSKEKIWRGPKEPMVTGSDASLGKSMLEGLRKKPDHIAQIFDHNSQEYTNKDIELMSIRIAQHLEEIGLQQEDVIGICASNTEYIAQSHGRILSATNVILSSEDKVLCFANITWVSTIMILLRAILYGWTRVITDQDCSPELFLRMVEQYKISVVFTVPSQMALAVQSPDLKTRDLSSLELYYSGGSPISLVAVRNFLEYAKNCKIFASYGMSEIAGGICLGTPNKVGEIGKVLPNLEVKIIDEHGNNLGICERGEICIKLPFKWPGYYGNQKATDAIYDKDGWLYSGDIGYFDEQGSIFLVDRKKEILRYIRYYVYPTEIEKMIVCLPDVVEVSVCGIPDIISNSLPAAAIVKKSNSNLTETEVINYVAERMADYKQLRGGVYFLDSLPKTHSGKTIRSEVLKIVEPLFEERKKEVNGRFPLNAIINWHC